MTYLINLLAIFLYYVFISNRYQRHPIKRNKIFSIIVCIHIVLFRALANPFNYSDTAGYAAAFDRIRFYTFNEAVLSINYDTAWGQGYVFLNWLIGQFTQESQWLFAIVAFLSITPVVWFHYKTSYRLFLSLFLYLVYPMMYFMGFGVIRQHLSIAFILLALYYINRWKIALPLFLTAVSCHTGSLVVLPFLFMRNLDISKYKPIKLFGFLIAGVVVSRFILHQFVYGMDRYGDVAQGEAENNIVPAVLICSLAFVYYISGALKRVSLDIDRKIINFLFYGMAIALFGIGQAGAGRLTLPFVYLYPIGLALLFKYSKDKVVTSGYTLLVFILIGLQYYISGFEQFRYSFFWNPIAE